MNETPAELRKGLVYTLTDRELAHAQAAGAARYRMNRARQCAERAMPGKPQPIDFEVCGVGGEIAFGRLAGVPLPPLVLEEWRDTVDLCLVDGRRVDVKSTKYSTGRLVEFLHPRQRADLYVLMVSQLPRSRFVVFRGAALPAELLRDENQLDLGYGPRYALDQDRLHPVTL